MNKPLRTRSVTRKSRESGFLLPIVGFLALVPPVISLFADDARIFGVPMIILYISFVWLMLIVGARWLAHRMSDDGS